MNMINFLAHKSIKFSALVTAFALQSPAVFAQTTSCNTTTSNLGEVAAELSCETGSLPLLFTSVSYVLGVGFTIAGLMKMKEYVDDPDRSFMKDALIRLGVGACLILLPFVIRTSAESFGGTSGGDFGRQSLEVF